jgi:hypothetical protein
MQETVKRRSRLSWLSLISALIFFIPSTEILAIIFGIWALVKIHKHRQILKGEFMAVAGIILGTMKLLFLVILAALLFVITPSLKPNLLEVKQNIKIAKVHIDFLYLEQLIDDYYKQDNRLPENLLILRESGLVKTLPPDPFSKNKEIYKYKPKDEARKFYSRADFLIYSLGPDGDDDGAQEQYSTVTNDGDIIKVGIIRKE